MKKNVFIVVVIAVAILACMFANEASDLIAENAAKNLSEAIFTL